MGSGIYDVDNYLCLWNKMARRAEFTETIMIYSETSRAQSIGGTLSSIMSGKGPYTFRSGTRSCTSDNDVRVKTKLKNKTNAATNKKKQQVFWFSNINPNGLPMSVFHRSWGNLGSSLIGAGILILITPFESVDLCIISSSSSPKYSTCAEGWVPLLLFPLGAGNKGCRWYKSPVTKMWHTD